MSCGQAHLCVINKLVRDRARGSIAQLLLRWKQKTSSWPQTLNTKQGYGSFNLFLHTPRPLSCRTASTMSMYILPLWIWISRPHVSRNHVYINTHVLYTCVYIYIHIIGRASSIRRLGFTIWVKSTINPGKSSGQMLGQICL